MEAPQCTAGSGLYKGLDALWREREELLAWERSDASAPAAVETLVTRRVFEIEAALATIEGRAVIDWLAQIRLLLEMVETSSTSIVPTLVRAVAAGLEAAVAADAKNRS
mgnify:CR=1 FL=1